MEKQRLITPSYCCILAANFLLYFGFWLLVPVLPFYLSEIFHASNTTIGIVLSCYTVSSLCIRPFSGYLLDTFARKPLYLFAYFIFTMIFAGYMFAGALTMFIIYRIIHGISFGMVTVGGGTSYIAIFSYGLGSCVLGFIAASMVKTPYKPPVKREPISLDRFIRFILIKGLPAGLSLLLLSIPYGMTTNYVAMYAKQIGITAETGFFFTLMAVGMAISRLFSGRLVDKGKITQVINAGLYLVCFCYFALTACGWLIGWNYAFTTSLFFLIALLLGIGFGTMFPAYNTLFVNLAPNNQRATATSTYLTSWDVGIGIGMLLGGYIAEIASFRDAYLFGATLTVVSMIYFHLKAGPHFQRNKLR